MVRASLIWTNWGSGPVKTRVELVTASYKVEKNSNKAAGSALQDGFAAIRIHVSCALKKIKNFLFIFLVFGLQTPTRHHKEKKLLHTLRPLPSSCISAVQSHVLSNMCSKTDRNCMDRWKQAAWLTKASFCAKQPEAKPPQQSRYCTWAWRPLLDSSAVMGMVGMKPRLWEGSEPWLALAIWLFARKQSQSSRSRTSQDCRVPWHGSRGNLICSSFSQTNLGNNSMKTDRYPTPSSSVQAPLSNAKPLLPRLHHFHLWWYRNPQQPAWNENHFHAAIPNLISV